jgi:hypothetical protein
MGLEKPGRLLAPRQVLTAQVLTPCSLPQLDVEGVLDGVCKTVKKRLFFIVHAVLLQIGICRAPLET